MCCGDNIYRAEIQKLMTDCETEYYTCQKMFDEKFSMDPNKIPSLADCDCMHTCAGIMQELSWIIQRLRAIYELEQGDNEDV